MITHIDSLEDTVIALSDAEDNSVEHKKAQRVAKKIKRKRIEKQRAANIDSNTSEENTSNRWSLRSKRVTTNNKTRIFAYATTTKNNNDSSIKDMELEDNQ